MTRRCLCWYVLPPPLDTPSCAKRNAGVRYGREQYDLLRSVPGVGEQVSLTLRADLPGPGKLDRKQIALWSGWPPTIGTAVPTGASGTVWGGRSRVRAARYMGAVVASRWNPVIRDFYQRLLVTGKPKKLALTECMRQAADHSQQHDENRRALGHDHRTT